MPKTLERLCEESIAFCTHTRCNKCEYGPHLTPSRTGHNCQAQMMADYLKKNGVVVQRWIPASEPPTVTGEYIAMIRGYARPMSLFYNFERGEWFVFAAEYRYDVTHWMPLPEPPKEVE